MREVDKTPIDPDRVRAIPPGGFSWIDRRFVREGFVKPLDRDAVLLYLFLVAVSDAQGISFYGDAALGKLLKILMEELKPARSQLIDHELILYRYPLYQVLPLPEQVKRSRPAKPASTPATRNDAPPCNENLMSLREFMRLKGREGPGEKGPNHG
jgi:hypothetical protein